MDEGEVPSTEKLRAEIMAVNDEYACSGLRVLAIAYRPWCLDGLLLRRVWASADMIFLG